MKDAVQRALRTFGQAFLGSLITSGILSGASVSGVVDWPTLEKIGISALAAGIIAVITFGYNALENTSNFPALLKTSPPAVNPVPNESK